MKTEVIQDILKAAECLLAGQVIAIPTETVYGLAARVFDETAIRRIFQIKGRPSDNPLIAHISNFDMGLKLTPFWPKDARLLAETFWPGPLTLVLPKNPNVPLIGTGGLDTIGIRMPRHPAALEIIHYVDEPLFAPSANLSGRPSPTCPQDVLEDLNGKIPLVFDGGECDVGIESTILSCVNGRYQILRPGRISQEELEDTLSASIETAPHTDRPLSPGMKYRHYAPNAKIEVVDHPLHAKGDFLIKQPTSQNLYRSFREADRKKCTLISIVASPYAKQEKGLMNRIEKAMAGDE